MVHIQCPARYHELVKTAFGKLAPLVEKHYPLTNYPYPSFNLAWAAVITDRTFACPALLSERLFARHVPTYGYEFADQHAPEFVKFPPDYPAGAYHASEVPFLFYPERNPGKSLKKKLSSWPRTVGNQLPTLLANWELVRARSPHGRNNLSRRGRTRSKASGHQSA